jgi:hypothetical protein
MSKSFAGERCVPWLFSQAGVRVEGEPQAVAPGVEAVRARIPQRGAVACKFGGIAGLFVAAVVLMAGSRPARAEAPSSASTVQSAAGYTIGGLSIGAFAVGRRLDRSAPALAVLCAGRDAALDERLVAELTGAARKRLADESWPDGQVWLISEAPLAPGAQAQAQAQKVRCFTPVQGKIVEV